MLVITLSYSDEDGWNIEVIDIETAFLEAELKEEVLIEIPDGYEFAFGEIDQTWYVMLQEWCKARRTRASSTSKMEMESLRQ